MTRIPSPETEEFYAFVMDRLEELEDLQFKFNKTRTVEDIDLLKTQMLKVVSDLDGGSGKWADTGLKNIYKNAFRSNGFEGSLPKGASARNLRHRKEAREGFRRASGDVRRWITDHSNEAKVGKARAIYRDQLRKAETAARSGDTDALKRVGAINEKIRGLPEFKEIPDEPTVFYRKNGKVISRRTARQYYDMAIQSAYARSNNLGVLEGSKDGSHFIVSDGADCGWLGHQDAAKMNGEVVTRDFALSAPIAHPYCQRTFTLADGPPGSRKLHKQLKALTGTAQRRAIRRLAQVGPVIDRGYDNFRTIMKVISIAKDSNITRMLIRQIELDNPGTLPAFATKSLRTWENTWGTNEQRYLLKTGLARQAEDLDPSFYAVEQLNQSLGPQFLTKYGWVDDIEVPDDLRELLGYKAGEVARKGDVVSRMEDYADFIAHRRAGEMIQGERLLDHTLHAESSEFVLAAMSRQFAAPRGFGTLKKLSRSYESAVKLAKTNPDKLGYELTRELAAYADFLPWWRTQYGPLRFGTGLTADGRRQLAGQLYRNVRSAKTFHPDDVTWAKSIGLHLDDSLKPKDFLKALQPRVSYTGRMMYYTIALENGKLAPILRVHPPFAGLRHLGFEANLAKRFESGRRYTPAQYLEALRGDYSKGGVQQVLYNLSQESLYTVSIFKDSPVHASLRLTGRHLESWAINTRADEKWIGTVWRLYGRPAVQMDEAKRTRVYSALVENGLSREDALKVLHLAEIPSNYQDNIFGTPLDSARRMLRKRLSEGMSEQSDEYAEMLRKIARLEVAEKEKDVRNIVSELLQQATRYEERFWVPRMDSVPGLPWGIEPRLMLTAAKMYAWQGDLLEVSRSLGISFADVTRMFHRAPDLFEGALDGFNLKMGIKASKKYLLEDLYEHSVLKKIADIIPRDQAGLRASAEFWIQKAKATQEWVLLPAVDKKVILKIELEILKQKAEDHAKHMKRRWDAYWKFQHKDLPSYFAAFDDLVPDEDAFRDNYLNRLLAEASDDYRGTATIQEEFEHYPWNTETLLAFRDDTDDFYKAWAQMFGGDLPDELIPEIDVGDGPLLKYSKNQWTPGVTVYRPDGTQMISVHHSAVKFWNTDFKTFMKASNQTGQFSQGETKNLLWHEVGHWLSNEISDPLTHAAKDARIDKYMYKVSDTYQDLWTGIMRELDPSLSDESARGILRGGYKTFKDADDDFQLPEKEYRFFQEIAYAENNAWEYILQGGYKDRLSGEVSLYGATSPRELIAELFSQYMTDSNPSALAKIVGETLIEGFKRKNNL